MTWLFPFIWYTPYKIRGMWGSGEHWKKSCFVMKYADMYRTVNVLKNKYYLLYCQAIYCFKHVFLSSVCNNDMTKHIKKLNGSSAHTTRALETTENIRTKCLSHYVIYIFWNLNNVTSQEQDNIFFKCPFSKKMQ